MALIISVLPSCGIFAASSSIPPTSESNSVVSQQKDLSPKKKKIHHHTPLVERYLTGGDLACGETYMAQYLCQHPGDDEARFGLGILQFLRSVETLGQNFYRYGLRSASRRIITGPLLHLPVPENPNPDTLSYENFRKIIDDFRIGLLKTDETLSGITSADVKVPLHFNLIKLDLDGDGIYNENDSLWKIYATVTGNTSMNEARARKFLICFDRGDVHWLRGYCHLLSAITEIYLAHDSRDTFERTAHLLFKKVQSPYPFLEHEARYRYFRGSDGSFLDLIALVHSVHWSVVEPKRMEAALHHLEICIEQSPISWRYIMAETDDDHEWLPNPRQTGVIPNVHVTEQMVDAWGQITTECGEILAGRLLIPFWRGSGGTGINLRKVFLEPTTLDVVYWVQGSAAAPYLQKGKCTDTKFWSRITEVFGHNFPGYAIWFN